MSRHVLVSKRPSFPKGFIYSPFKVSDPKKHARNVLVETTGLREGVDGLFGQGLDMIGSGEWAADPSKTIKFCNACGGLQNCQCSGLIFPLWLQYQIPYIDLNILLAIIQAYLYIYIHVSIYVYMSIYIYIYV